MAFTSECQQNWIDVPSKTVKCLPVCVCAVARKVVVARVVFRRRVRMRGLPGCLQRGGLSEQANGGVCTRLFEGGCRVAVGQALLCSWVRKRKGCECVARQEDVCVMWEVRAGNLYRGVGEVGRGLPV